MLVYKKKYFLFLENIKDIDLSNIKLANKFIIIYRKHNKTPNYHELLRFRERCKSKRIEFYIANNLKLMMTLKADGLYISAFNNKLKLSKLKKTKFKIIGSAHNVREINIKNTQGCNYIMFSRLFETNYKDKRNYLGIIKFNLIRLSRKEKLVPLGGINILNLNKLKNVNSDSFAILSEVKKKPARIFSRLF